MPAIAGLAAAAVLVVEVGRRFATTGDAPAPTHTQVSFVNDASYPALSAEGGLIAYVRGEPWGEAVQTVAARAPQQVVIHDLASNQTIAVAECRPCCRAPAGHPRDSRSLKRWLGGPAWSPDGTRLAFCAEDQDARKVWTILADGGPPVAFPDSRCTAWGSEVPVSWAPGREILYQRDGNQNYHTLDPESGREAPLLPQPERGWAFGPRPHASDVALMWNHPDGRGVWIVRAGNPPRFLTDGVWPLAWSRDGRTIHGFNDRSGDIVAITVRTGGAHIRRTLQRLRVGLVPAITPDLEQVIYSAHAIFADVWTVKDFDPARTRRR